MNLIKFNKKIVGIVIVLILIIFVYYIAKYIYNEKGKGKGKGKSKGKGKGKGQCSNGCPNTKKQNEIYQFHNSYKEQRAKNSALTKSSGGAYFRNSNNNGPANVFVIRHGEKISKHFALDCNGILRSTLIPDLIENLNNNGYGINVIVSMNNYEAMHVQQTILLTTWLLNIPVFIYGEQNDQQITIANVFNNPYFNGKNVLICWEHTCIQELIQQIITIGPKAKGLTNYKFVNPEGNSDLPVWDKDNFQSILHFDSQLNFETFAENFTTCFPDDNDLLTYGTSQSCEAVPAYTLVTY